MLIIIQTNLITKIYSVFLVNNFLVPKGTKGPQLGSTWGGVGVIQAIGYVCCEGCGFQIV